MRGTEASRVRPTRRAESGAWPIEAGFRVVCASAAGAALRPQRDASPSGHGLVGVVERTELKFIDSREVRGVHRVER